MNLRLLILLALMVAVPLAVLGWLGVRLHAAELAAKDDLVDKLYTEELKRHAQNIAGLVGEYESEISQQLDTAPLEPAGLRELLQRSPYVTQFFVLNPQGVVRYPVFEDNGLRSEQEFLLRTRDIWLNGELTTQAAPEQPAQSTARGYSKASVQNIALAERHSGWYVWHWGSDIHLVLWSRRPDGIVVGAEINRSRLVADIIVSLPASLADEVAFPAERTELRNSRDEVIYTYGATNDPGAMQQRVTLSLDYPLNTWSFVYFVNPKELQHSIQYAPAFLYRISTQLGAVALSLIALAVYLYRENARNMREAAQRVTFVNQVSHELKTPLTNIRMYAEMLEENLDPSDDQAKRHVGVLVSESQRLSRLIANILTFNRKERHALTLRSAPGIIDTCVQSILAQFRPALDARGITVMTDLHADQPAMIDTDVIGQIVGNLVSNVEKYAATGRQLTVATSQHGDTVTISVADAGPGIPSRERARIFDAFYRISDKLTDGVAGTGIGLTIARELAQMHGGGLTLQPSERGARFVVTLHCPPNGDTA